MKRIFIILLIGILVISGVGCQNNDKNSTNSSLESLNNIDIDLPAEDNVVEPETNESETPESNESEAPEEEPEEEVDVVIEAEPIDPEGKIFSKLTGLEISEEQSLKRPIVVMLDNHYKARPQSGLSDAEVIYEVLAEGLITRYMAVFQANEPEVIGPVRSARPYYVERALEFNPLYVHVGGSMAALADIDSYNMGDIDGLSVGAGVFYRTTHKFMPHNAYSSHDGIRKEGDRKGYYTEVEFAGLPISYDTHELNGEIANYVKVRYMNATSGGNVGYYIEYDYDAEAQNYVRSVNGENYKDEETDIQLVADNIIIQKVNHVTIDNEGRRSVKMIGSGSGYYVNRGTYIPMTWEKDEARGQTRFYKEDGSELILNPGITWVQVVPTNNEPYIE